MLSLELVVESGVKVVVDGVFDVGVEMAIKVLSHLLENRSVEATSELDATKSGIPSNNYLYLWMEFLQLLSCDGTRRHGETDDSFEKYNGLYTK